MGNPDQGEQSQNVSGQSMGDADFSGEELPRADFSGAILAEADFSGATLWEADFSDATLVLADFSEANLINSDFTGARLSGADFSNAILFDSSFQDSTVSRSTKFNMDLSVMKETYEESAAGNTTETQMWGAISRIYHELKIAHSNSGLIGRARKYHVKERWSRRKEAKADGGFKGYFAWFGSLLSRIVTGYGVQLRWPVFLMALLFLTSMTVYWTADMGIQESAYYSIVTFTTSPPYPPADDLLIEVTTMIETFCGTLLVILLGYVLGNREQI